MQREVKVTLIAGLASAAQVASAALAARAGAADGLLLALDAGLLFVAGLAYAFYIALRPFRPRLTWLSVAAGCAVTNTGMSIALYVLTRDLLVASLPWWAYAITGLSMITLQVYKSQAQDRVAEAEGEMNHAGQ